MGAGIGDDMTLGGICVGYKPTWVLTPTSIAVKARMYFIKKKNTKFLFGLKF